MVMAPKSGGDDQSPFNSRIESKSTRNKNQSHIIGRSPQSVQVSGRKQVSFMSEKVKR